MKTELIEARKKLSEKEETLAYLAELVAYVYTKAMEVKRIITTKQ